MIEVQIGNTKKNLEHTNPSWINEQLDRRRRESELICVQVFMDRPQMHIRLSTPDCPPVTGGRSATPQEQELFDMWEKRGLNDANFASGNLVAFLKQVSKY